MRCLVEYGADIDLEFSFVEKANCEAWVASLEECFDTADEILTASARHAAVRHGNLEITLFLLRKGAKVDARPENEYGHTALHLLLEWKADVNAPAIYEINRSPTRCQPSRL